MERYDAGFPYGKYLCDCGSEDIGILICFCICYEMAISFYGDSFLLLLELAAL